MTELQKGRRRCYLVYAVAPEGMSAREAIDLLNEYVEDGRRGIAIFHDHFTGSPHGGLAVFDVRDEQAYELLGDAGPLEGWRLDTHALTYALTAEGFGALVEWSAKAATGKTLAELAAEEPDDPRFWWRHE